MSPQLILGAKCHMIRDTQLLEKQLIAKELEEEEKRLATMMEVERKKAEEMREELERRRRQELIRFAEGSLFPPEASRPLPRLCAGAGITPGFTPQHLSQSPPLGRAARGSGRMSLLEFLLLGVGRSRRERFRSLLCRGRQEIVKQMEQNAEERAVRAEQRDQEAQEMLAYLEKLKMEDLKVPPVTRWGAGAGTELDFHLLGRVTQRWVKPDLMCGANRRQD